jgi:hypothetical protein
MNPHDIKNLNRSLTNKETETVIRSLPTKKSLRADRLIAEFYQTFKKELTSRLLKLFQEIEREGIPPNLILQSQDWPATKS